MRKIYLLFFLSLFFVIGMSSVSADAMHEGTYKIESALKSNMVLTSSGGSDASNVSLNTFSNSNNQKWDLTDLGSGYYKITSKANSSMALDVQGASKSNKANVQIYSSNNTDAQTWILKSIGNGYFYIVSKCNNLYLDVDGAKTADGTNIQMYQGNGTSAQKFKLTEIVDNPEKTIDSGTYVITSKINGDKALNIDNNNINIKEVDSSYLEAFKVEYNDEGYYTIKKYSDNKFVGINNDSKESNVLLLDESDKTKWILKENSDGTYSFVSYFGHYYMDLKGGKTSNGTNVQIYDGNGTDAQKFNLTKVEFEDIEDGIYTISTFTNNEIVLALNNEIALNGGNVELSEKNGNNKEKWHFKNISENIYEIKSAIDDSYVFDISGGNINNGGNVQIYKTNETDAQRFRVIKVDNEAYRFTNVNSKKNVDVQGGKISIGSNVQQYENNNTIAQKFKLEKTTASEYSQDIENGKYIIYSTLNLNKSLRCSSNVFIYDVEGSLKEIFDIEYIDKGYYYIKNGDLAITNTNGKITMEDYKGEDNQKWFFKKVGDNYTFVSKVDGKVLDVPSGNASNNNRLQTYTSNGTKSQQFYLEAVLPNDLETGYYKMSIGSNYLGLDREIAYNGALPNMTSLKTNSTQKWYIKKIRNNTYEIKYALNPNKVLDVKGGGTSDGNIVQMYESNSTDSQRWNVVKLKNGSYKFISNISHKCLTADNNTKIYSNDEDKNQKFILTSTDEVTVGQTVEDGYYVISSALDGNKVLDIKSGSIKSGTNVQLYSYNSSVAQIWKVYYVENGVYYIKSALNPKRALTRVGGNVQSEKFTGNDNQKWYIKHLENNKLSIISVTDSLFVDVSGGRTNDGTNIGVYEGNNTPSQQFKLNGYGKTKNYHGIDISRWQGTIDWNKLSSTDISFVIARAGFGMYSHQKDDLFEEYYSNAKSYDYAVGTYTYSYAQSVEEAKREANETIGWIKGKSFELPVFYDLEDKSQIYLGKNTLTNMAEAFCDIIIKNGYQCGIYANKNWFTNYLDASRLSSKYPIWLAHYTNGYNRTSYNEALSHYGTDYTGSYQFWQFSSVGSLEGIGGDVDLDFGYDIFD